MSEDVTPSREGSGPDSAAHTNKFRGGLSILIVALVALVGVFSDGPPIEKYKIKGPTLVVVAIFLFAALIRPFGLIIATYLAFIVSIMGSSEMRWIESVVAAAVMTLFCVLLYVYLLG